jgi:hypothetical protein
VALVAECCQAKPARNTRSAIDRLSNRRFDFRCRHQKSAFSLPCRKSALADIRQCRRRVKLLILLAISVGSETAPTHRMSSGK